VISLAFTEQQPATVYCGDCKLDFCEACRAKLHSAKSFAAHQVVDQARKPAVAPLPQCEKHRGRNLDVFCIDCNVRCLNVALVFIFLFAKEER